MTDVIIVLGYLSFSIFTLLAIMTTVFTIGILIVFGPAYITEQIKLFLRSNISFMRWLYGDEYTEKMPVKVYSEGWREGDYK